MAMSPEEKRRIKEQRYQENANKAFEIFYSFGVKERSVAKVFEYMKAWAKEKPEEAHLIPTRNKPTLYRWAEEYKWEERALTRDRELNQKIADDYEALVRDAHKELKLASMSAVQTLKDAMTSPEAAQGTRVRAAEAILDRAGIVAPSRNAPRDNGDGEKELTLPESMDSADLIKWLIGNSH